MKKLLLIISIMSISAVSFADSGMRCVTQNSAYEFDVEGMDYTTVRVLDENLEQEEVESTLTLATETQKRFTAEFVVDSANIHVIDANYSMKDGEMSIYSGTITMNGSSSHSQIICTQI